MVLAFIWLGTIAPFHTRQTFSLKVDLCIRISRVNLLHMASFAPAHFGDKIIVSAFVIVPLSMPAFLSAKDACAILLLPFVPFVTHLAALAAFAALPSVPLVTVRPADAAGAAIPVPMVTARSGKSANRTFAW